MRTQKDIRQSFWETHPEFKEHYRVSKRQNEYITDIRVCFCDYVDSLQKGGLISEKLVRRVTL